MESANQLVYNIPDNEKPRVVIIGGGFGGLYAARGLQKKGFQVVVFDKRNYHTFQPLLYQVATAGLQPDSIVGPLRKAFSKYEDFYFRMLKVQSINPDVNTVTTVAGDLHYDYLIVANGMKANFFGNEQMKKHAIPMKWVPDAINLRSHLMQMLEWANLTEDNAARERILTIVLVGGGPTGVETAGALSELRKYVLPNDYPAIDFNQMKIYLVEGLDRVLPPMSQRASEKSRKDLEKMGIIIKVNTLVDTFDGEKVVLKGGEEIATNTVIWSAGVTGDVIPGLKKEWLERNRILCDDHCKVKGSANIFAIGDIALIKSEKYPKGHPGVAQPAIQMGKYIGKNLADLHQQKAVKPFKYFDKGTLATIGRGKAVADLPGKLFLGGRPAWWIWLFIHISFLISFRNKLLVFTNWVWNYLTYDKGNRLIIRPYTHNENEVAQSIFLINETE